MANVWEYINEDDWSEHPGGDTPIGNPLYLFEAIQERKTEAGHTEILQIVPVGHHHVADAFHYSAFVQYDID